MKVQVIVHQAEEGGYWAEVPALPGCFSQGETWEEVMANVREAVEGWLLASQAANMPPAQAEADQTIEMNV